MSKKYNDAEETSYTEPRYINANILIDLATHEGAYGYVDVQDIRNTPTADVVERKRGKWVKLDDNSFHCQLCGHTFIIIQGESFMNYCPSCGADMI